MTTVEMYHILSQMATVLANRSAQKDIFAPASSFIMSCEYDAPAAALTMTFKNGTQIKYLRIFPATWLAFKAAPNHSLFYHQFIKGSTMNVPVVKKSIGKNPNKGARPHVQRTAGNAPAVTRGTVNRAFARPA